MSATLKLRARVARSSPTHRVAQADLSPLPRSLSEPLSLLLLLRRVASGLALVLSRLTRRFVDERAALEEAARKDAEAAAAKAAEFERKEAEKRAKEEEGLDEAALKKLREKRAAKDAKKKDKKGEGKRKSAFGLGVSSIVDEIERLNPDL